MPGDEPPPPYEVLAALVASLRGEPAEAAGALARARAALAHARERIAEQYDLVSRETMFAAWPDANSAGHKSPLVIADLGCKAETRVVWATISAGGKRYSEIRSIELAQPVRQCQPDPPGHRL